MTAVGTDLLRNYVGGAWVHASSSEALDVTNPATGETLARVPLSARADLDAAVRAAREALPAWRGVTVMQKTVTSRWFSSGQGSGAYFVER